MTFIALIVLLKYKDHQIIRRNTPMISVLMLIGLLMTGFSGIITCFGVYTYSCIIYGFFYNIGFSLVIGGIIAKEYRIYRIFSNRSALALDIQDYKLFLIIGTITTYFLILAFIPIMGSVYAAVRRSDSNEFYLYWTCYFDSKVWKDITLFFTEISFVILRLLAILLAWKTRKVTAFYSESRAVFAVVIIYLCLNIIFIPLYQALSDGTDSAIYRYSIRLINISITMGATLILLFYYRFWLIYKYERNKKKYLRLRRTGSNVSVNMSGNNNMSNMSGNTSYNNNTTGNTSSISNIRNTSNIRYTSNINNQ